MADSDLTNEHKRMAMGGAPDTGNFGVQQLAEHAAGTNPDLRRQAHRIVNNDANRAAGKPIDRGSGMHPAQAGPNHGPTGYGGR